MCGMFRIAGKKSGLANEPNKDKRQIKREGILFRAPKYVHCIATKGATKI